MNRKQAIEELGQDLVDAVDSEDYASAAAYAASAAVYAAASAASADVRKQTLSKCADICRSFISFDDLKLNEV